MIVSLLLARSPGLINQRTRNDEELTPLLLACSSGALDTVRRLLEEGATPTLLTMKSERGVIHLAALNKHVKVRDTTHVTSY